MSVGRSPIWRLKSSKQHQLCNHLSRNHKLQILLCPLDQSQSLVTLKLVHPLKFLSQGERRMKKARYLFEIQSLRSMDQHVRCQSAQPYRTAAASPQTKTRPHKRGEPAGISLAVTSPPPERAWFLQVQCSWEGSPQAMSTPGNTSPQWHDYTAA